MGWKEKLFVVPESQAQPEPLPQRERTVLERRAAQLPYGEIVDWIDTTLNEVIAAMNSFRAEPTIVDHLDKAVADADALRVLLTELAERTIRATTLDPTQPAAGR